MEGIGRHRTDAVRRRPLAALAVLVAIGLAGCTGEDDPVEDPTGKGTAPSSSTTTSGTQSLTSSGTTTAAPVDLPAEAKERTAAGAEAFARWYIEATAEALMTNDTSELEAAIGTCPSCLVLVGVINENKAKGHHYAKVGQVLGLSQVLEGTVSSGLVVGVLADYAENVVIDKSGKKVAIVNATKANFEVTAAWRSGWKVDRVVRR